APDDLDFEALRLQLIDAGEAPVQLMFAATSVDQAEGELETISSVLMEVASRLPAGAGLDAAVWYMNNVWQRGGGNAVTTLPCIVQEFDGGAMVVARLGDGESIESFSGVISHFDGTSPDVELCRQMQAQAEAAATDAGAAAAATGDTTDTVAETTGSTATVDYSVPPTEAVALINAGEHTIIDVRTPGEYEQAHVVGAINIDVEAPDFAERIAELDPDVPYLLYCRTGRRSNLAAQQMAAAGFTDLTDGRGLADLARAGAPVE
ncbi:MAG: rhodanese-like domain-containing protein, partial [Chloroflexota bacterium]